MTLKTRQNALLIITSVAILSVAIVGVIPNEIFAAQQTGQDIIKSETTPRTNVADRAQMQEYLEKLFNEKTTADEKRALENKINILQDKSRSESKKLAPELQASLDEKKDILSQEIRENNFSVNNILDNEAINSIGVSVYDESVTIGIDPDTFDTLDTKQVFNSMRKLVGNDINIVLISEASASPATCTSQTGECEPVEGGVKMEVSTHNPCSVGFQAERTIGSTTYEGFITAGHCATLSKTAYQPTDSWGNDIGTVTEEDYYNNTYCDCAFIQSDESVTDQIYPNVYPPNTSDPAVDDYVIMKGYASLWKFGQVDVINTDVKVGGLWVKDGFKADFVANLGDSGGPVYESGSTPYLMGIISGVDSSATPLWTFMSTASNLNVENSNLDWDFS